MSDLFVDVDAECPVCSEYVQAMVPGSCGRFPDFYVMCECGTFVLIQYTGEKDDS